MDRFCELMDNSAMSPEEALAYLKKTRLEGLAAVAAAPGLAALREIEVRLLGRKGFLARITAELGRMPPEARRELGVS
jgi:hypothetical protein